MNRTYSGIMVFWATIPGLDEFAVRYSLFATAAGCWAYLLLTVSNVRRIAVFRHYGFVVRQLQRLCEPPVLAMPGYP